MELKRLAFATLKAVTRTAEGVQRFAKLEQILAGLCLLIPFLLIAFDGWHIRPSISDYHDMLNAQVFYVPLTIAAMLFVVNGVIKHKRIYNTILGIMLAGIVLFDHDGLTRYLHAVFVIAFFGGNLVVMVLYSPRKERWFKILLVLGILAAAAGWYPLGWYSLLWAEWVSFAIIALHYILESLGLID